MDRDIHWYIKELGFNAFDLTQYWGSPLTLEKAKELYMAKKVIKEVEDKPLPKKDKLACEVLKALVERVRIDDNDGLDIDQAKRMCKASVEIAGLMLEELK